jgi:Flp pilus assembly protein TadG
MLPIRRVLQRMIAWLDADEGASAVEFGIIAPVLAAVLVPLIDLGLGFYQQMQVEDAAQAGAQYAMAHGWNTSAIQSAVTSATALAAVSASPAPARSCGCPSGTAVSVVDCGSACDDGRSARTYVTVSAQATYTTLIPYPTIGSSVVLTAQSTVRVQ